MPEVKKKFSDIYSNYTFLDTSISVTKLFKDS